MPARNQLTTIWGPHYVTCFFFCEHRISECLLPFSLMVIQNIKTSNLHSNRPCVTHFLCTWDIALCSNYTADYCNPLNQVTVAIITHQFMTIHRSWFAVYQPYSPWPFQEPKLQGTSPVSMALGGTVSSSVWGSWNSNWWMWYSTSIYLSLYLSIYLPIFIYI